MDKKRKKQMGGAFFYERDDRSVSDVGLHEDLLRDEDRIRQELIAAGVIKEIILENKKPNKK